MPIELKNSPNFIHMYKMEEHKHHSMGGLDGLRVFEDLGGWVGLVENTRRLSRAHLNFLSAIFGLVYSLVSYFQSVIYFFFLFFVDFYEEVV
jgi:hypothetical protein